MADVVNKFVGLFTRTPKEIGGILIDCFATEEHDSEIKFTEFPIEVGANINDHAIILPKMLTINAVVSNIPNNLTGVNLQSFTAGNSKTRAISAYEALITLQERREPIDVVTDLKLYKNMGIVSIKVNRDKDTSGGLFFTCTFKELIIVTNEYTRIPPGVFREGATREQYSQTTQGGRKVAETTRDSTILGSWVPRVNAAKDGL